MQRVTELPQAGIQALSRAQGWCFDLDGTLLDTLADLATATAFALEPSRVPPIEIDRFKTLIGSGLKQLFVRIWHQVMAQKTPLPAEQLQEWMKRFEAYYAQHDQEQTRPYRGIADVLSALKQRGCCLAVLTNKQEPAAQRLVQAFFPGVFDLVLGQHEAVSPKPDVAFTQLLQARTGIALSQWVMVGDSEVDIETALNAGLYPVGVSWGFRCPEQLRQAGASVIVDQPETLRRWIETLGSGGIA